MTWPVQHKVYRWLSHLSPLLGQHLSPILVPGCGSAGTLGQSRNNLTLHKSFPLLPDLLGAQS